MSGFLCVTKGEEIKYKLRSWNSGCWVSVEENLRWLFWGQTITTILCWVVLITLLSRDHFRLLLWSPKSQASTYTIQKSFGNKAGCVCSWNVYMVLVTYEAEERPKKSMSWTTGMNGSLSLPWNAILRNIASQGAPVSVAK